jgi:peptidoglycan hydrolase-like protein with peptidoglycan-binding domain
VELKSQLVTLLQQAESQGIPLPSDALAILLNGGGSSPTGGSAPVTSGEIFSADLRFLEVSPDVIRLQQYLNDHGFLVAQNGPGSPGHETNRFGAATLAQLKRFQKSIGLNPTGFFGPQTRGYVNDHMQ